MAVLKYYQAILMFMFRGIRSRTESRVVTILVELIVIKIILLFFHISDLVDDINEPDDKDGFEIFFLKRILEKVELFRRNGNLYV